MFKCKGSTFTLRLYYIAFLLFLSSLVNSGPVNRINMNIDKADGHNINDDTEIHHDLKVRDEVLNKIVQDSLPDKGISLQFLVLILLLIALV